MRLIDADLLSEAIHDNVPAPYEDASWAKENCLAEIDAAPTVDAVPVVRCDKCKHFKHDEANDEWYCKKSGADIEYVDSLTHFCSYGERKEGAD